MAVRDHETAQMQEQDPTPRRVERRGILAGTAALVAALMAREVAQAPPVAASGTSSDYFIATGLSSPGGTGFGTTGYFDYAMYGYGNTVGLYGETGTGSGVYGYSNSISGGGNGVFGVSNSGYGVYGTSSGNHAVYGNLGTAMAGKAGVYGSGSVRGTYGVLGTGGQAGIGVCGVSYGGYGVVGYANSGDIAALYGSSSSAGAPAFAAYNGVAGGLAGTFNGNVYINGSYTATGTKSAAVPHPDGSHRLLYCIESPEAWFEDFGRGALSAGSADVQLDPDFAAVVDTNTLHVFLTPHDTDHHLAVTTHGARSFTVGAAPGTMGAAAGKKASDLNGAFSYRVVAKRKDVQAGRLAKVDLPKIPAPPPPPPAEPKPKAPMERPPR